MQSNFHNSSTQVWYKKLHTLGVKCYLNSKPSCDITLGIVIVSSIVVIPPLF